MNDLGEGHEALINRAIAVKARHEDELMNRPGVVGVGVGLRQKGGSLTDEVCIVVMVRQKHPREELDPSDLLPTELEGIPVDVLQTGDLTAK